MNRLFLYALLILLHCTAVAQVQVGPAPVPALGSPGRFGAGDIAAFRQTTTLFTLQSGDYNERVTAFTEAIKKVWTITPFRVITPDSVQQYINDRRYSFATFGTYDIPGEISFMPQLSYDIWMPQFTANNRFRGKLLLGRATLSPAKATVLHWPGKGSVYDFMYDRASFSNWQPCFLANYLKIINDGLLQERRRGMFDAKKEPDALRALKENTLYIPASAMTGADSADLVAAYPYAIKCINDEELSRLVMPGMKPIYYLVFIKNDAHKYISVYASDGRELYTAHRTLRDLLDRKDLQRIVK